MFIGTLDPPQEVMQLHAELCAALSDPHRIMIIYALAEQNYTVSDLAARLNYSQPSTSRHLKILRDRGLVRATRMGSSVEYSLTDPRLLEALNLLWNVLKDSIGYRVSLIESKE